VTLDKPQHLRELRDRKVAGIVAFAIGAVSFVVALVVRYPQSDPDYVALGLGALAVVATLIAAAISLFRRERAFALWPMGIALAVASLFVTWVVVAVLVLGAFALLVLILHHVL